MEAEKQYEDAYLRRTWMHAPRGFYPVVALADASMPSSPTSQAPRPPKSKGKGMFKKGRGKSPSAWQSKGGTIVARGQAASSKICEVWPWAGQLPSEHCEIKPYIPAEPFNSDIHITFQQPKTDGNAMMVRDMANISQPGIPPLSQHGWYGIRCGGASSVVVDHTTLMNIFDYMKKQSVLPGRYTSSCQPTRLLALVVTPLDKLIGL